ncbi:hypothetical protein ACOSQ3_017442 [Xanthoceras sorbifolium]
MRDKTDAPTKDPTAAEAPLASPAGAGAGAKTSLDARATLVMEAATMRTVQEIFFMSMFTALFSDQLIFNCLGNFISKRCGDLVVSNSLCLKGSLAVDDAIVVAAFAATAAAKAAYAATAPAADPTDIAAAAVARAATSAAATTSASVTSAAAAANFLVHL